MDVVYVTGNAEKARSFALQIGVGIPHAPAELDEIQTLNPRELVEHKARQAYQQLNRPVLVEDVCLSFTALEGLPGPFIKFFVSADDETASGVERLCRLLDGFDDRTAVASCTFGYFDGTEMRYFEGALAGAIARHPAGKRGFGFDPIFVPEGFGSQTAAELNEEDYGRYYAIIKPFGPVREFFQGDMHDR